MMVTRSFAEKIIDNVKQRMLISLMPSLNVARNSKVKIALVSQATKISSLKNISKIYVCR